MSVTTEQGHGLGWRPQVPDHRDKAFHLVPPKEIPERVDLREAYADNMPPVWDQGAIGSCTAQSVGAAWFYAASRAGHDPVDPSRLFVYYYERVIEDSVEYDSGAEIRDGFKVLAKRGVPPETEWPYDVARFADMPPAKARADARAHKATRYLALDASVDGVCAALAAGWGVSFGFTVYESFESPEVAKTGVVPDPTDEKKLGGHAVWACGYDQSDEVLIVRNSWGEGWGDKGYFYLPFSYFDAGLISDCWACEVAS